MMSSSMHSDPVPLTVLLKLGNGSIFLNGCKLILDVSEKAITNNVGCITLVNKLPTVTQTIL